MSELIGSGAKAAYKPASAWGTAETLGAGDQVEYASETVVPEPQLSVSDQINGDALAGASQVDKIVTQGEMQGMDLKYEGMERWLEHVFGDIATTGGAGVYQHIFDWELTNEGKFGTLAIDKAVEVHECDSFKPMGITIVGASGTPVKVTVRGIARQLRVDDPDRTNDASTSWTLPNLIRRIAKFGQTTIEVAAPPVAVAASGTVTFTGQPSPDDAIVIGIRTYKFVVTPTDDFDVKVGADFDASMTNLVDAINMEDPVGTGDNQATTGRYRASVANAAVTATVDLLTNVITLTCRTAGTAGNSTTFTETLNNATISGSGTLTGGAAGTQSWTALCTSGYQLSFQRNGDPVQTTCDGDYASEPSTDTHELTFQLDFPIYDDDNHFLVVARQAGTVLSARFTWDSGVDLGAGPANVRWILYIPAFQLTGSGYPSVNGKGKVPLSCQCTVHSAETPIDTDATMPRLYVHNTVPNTTSYA